MTAFYWGISILFCKVSRKAVVRVYGLRGMEGEPEVTVGRLHCFCTIMALPPTGKVLPAGGGQSARSATAPTTLYGVGRGNPAEIDHDSGLMEVAGEGEPFLLGFLHVALMHEGGRDPADLPGRGEKEAGLSVS
jgi:hypothetical protein